MQRRNVGSWLAVAIAWIVAGQAPGVALAQAPPPRNPLMQVRPARVAPSDADDGQMLDGVFLPPDRTAKRRLEMAQQLLGERRYGETLRLLGSLLESPEDYFFKPQADQPVYHSLKAEASRLIAAMPAEGLESYELQFGARARQMLEQAVRGGNLTDLAEVSRRFFFTRAGQDATFLLARHHLDENRPLAAALCIQRMYETPTLAARLEPMLSLELAVCWLRAGQSEKAKEALVRLRKSHGSEVLLGGKPVKLFTKDAQALAWLQEHLGRLSSTHPSEADQWVMFRGDESRNAPSTGGQPLLNVRWRQRTTDDRTVERFIGKMRGDYLSQDIVALPSLHPLAIGDVVVMRTAFALQAVDFRNGKLVWRYPTSDDSFEQFMKAGSTPQPGQGSAQLFSALDQRMWEDAVYGTLSSDGVQVYFVEDLGLAGVASTVHTTVLPNGVRREGLTSRNTNRLAARELRTQGKLKWEVGGLTGEDEPRLAGAFFLGPPLPLQGHLYALAEMKGQEIRLVVLSAKTGALEWSQQLAVVEPSQSVAADGFRRNAGAVPSFADGVLVCPTSAGAIVAIDLTTRSLLWGYQYPRMQASPPDRFNALRFTVYQTNDRRFTERWADGSVTIASGRALVTPVETDQLYCLNLADGHELWKLPRNNHLYIGCVHHDKVILIGRDRVSAVQLSNGQPAWPKTLDLPSGSLPSGRGFYSGDYYYLPLSSAEVAKIDLRKGTIEQRARSRRGTIPGNLICYRDSILSQGADYLDAYYQLDALKQQIAKSLEQRPDDPTALAELAEIKLDQGSLGEAIEMFRRSYRLNADDTTRDRLIEALLEGLRQDFATYRGNLPEVESLIEQPRDRLTLVRLKALGLQTAGEVLPAFQSYMELIDADAPTALDAIDERLSVRRDRWVRQQIEQLRSSATVARQAQIDEAVAARLKSALEADSPEALRGFLAVFGLHPSADAARDALLARLPASDTLERTWQLHSGESSESKQHAAAAVARLAQLLRDSGRNDLAAVYYRQLQGPLADVVCHDGKTGRQLVAELPADDPLRGLLAAVTWPLGKVQVSEEKPQGRGNTVLKGPSPAKIEIVGREGALFDGVTISYDATQRMLAGQDGLGTRRFRVRLDDGVARPFLNTPRYSGFNVPAPSYASVNGGLVVMAMGHQLLAVDTLRPLDGSSNRVLWTHDLGEQIGGLPTNQALSSRPQLLPWGATRFVTQDGTGRRFGCVGPLNDDGFCFQRLHDLYCVDPLSGKTVWVRKNVGIGNDLFGDGELLFVAPPGDGDTLVIRASNGEQLGTRRVAPFDKRMLTIGRQVLSWETAGEQQVMQLRDPWQDRTLWAYKFAPNSKAALVRQEVVGVLQPDGEFTLVTLADGKTLVKEQLEGENAILSIYLLRSQQGYLLITNTNPRHEPNVSVQLPTNSPNTVMITGRVYAFDGSSGKKLWPSPAVVASHGLVTSQPGELPVLVFVRQLHRPGGPPGIKEPKNSLLCIDKRTGRVAYTSDQLPGAFNVNPEVVGDPAAHSVTLTMPQSIIKLQFTDEALEPQSNALRRELIPRLGGARRSLGVGGFVGESVSNHGSRAGR